MGQFRTKLVEIKAIRLSHKNLPKIKEWMGGQYTEHHEVGESNILFLPIKTANGIVEATEGNWILTDSDGLFYPCVDSVFKAKYEAV